MGHKYVVPKGVETDRDFNNLVQNRVLLTTLVSFKLYRIKCVLCVS